MRGLRWKRRACRGNAKPQCIPARSGCSARRCILAPIGVLARKWPEWLLSGELPLRLICLRPAVPKVSLLAQSQGAIVVKKLVCLLALTALASPAGAQPLNPHATESIGTVRQV